MKISEYHLGFVGFGHMAQVIFQALAQAKLIPRSQVTFTRRDTQKMRQNEQEFGITSTTLETLVKKSDILILGVRPAQAPQVLQKLQELGVEGKMIISVMAGIKLAYYQKHLGSKNFLLRVMPNIASAVGEGMSVFTFGPGATNEFKSTAHLLFSCMGEVMEIPEELVDIATGISGSGPGFVFRLIEALARTGEKNGLSYEQALKMAAQTFAGAARLILKGNKPETLIQQIATPNGVTEAGFKVMRELEVGKSLQSVAEASARRSKELSEEFFD